MNYYIPVARNAPLDTAASPAKNKVLDLPLMENATMSSRTLHAVAAVATLALAASAWAAVEVGQPAPDFKAQDLSGAAHSLAEYRGKYVVLEWNNPGCPFVQKHYDSGNMQK